MRLARLAVAIYRLSAPASREHGGRHVGR
jgi:hypothetical protein